MLPPELYPLAMCNDGTHANYHVQNYHQQGKIVICLQGGAYCDTIESCTERCEPSNLCTAEKAPQLDIGLQPDIGGLSKDPFKDYTQIRVHYFSSDTNESAESKTHTKDSYHDDV